MSLREVRKLKEKEEGVVILAHNYQRPEIQRIADFIGDSLELSRKATEIEAETIVFCGVDFMAETAKILNPDKEVLIPDRNARCPMASMLSVDLLTEYKKRYSEAEVVLYVNTTAECKALADVICTSANAHSIIEKLEADVILFGPDANLAHYVRKRTGKKVIPIPEWGHCPVHVSIGVDDLKRARNKYPNARVMAHPECLPEVQEKADLVASTSQMIKKACSHNEWIVLTEREMCHRLKTIYPNKKFYPGKDAVCINMKKITVEKVKKSLESHVHEVNVPKDISKRARRAIEKMFELTL